MKKEITAKEAAKIIKDKCFGKSIIECFELSDCYAFALVDIGDENEVFGGGYYTINKQNGKLACMTSVELAFSEVKRVDINELK